MAAGKAGTVASVVPPSLGPSGSWGGGSARPQKGLRREAGRERGTAAGSRRGAQGRGASARPHCTVIPRHRAARGKPAFPRAHPRLSQAHAVAPALLTTSLLHIRQDAAATLCGSASSAPTCPGLSDPPGPSPHEAHADPSDEMAMTCPGYRLRTKRLAPLQKRSPSDSRLTRSATRTAICRIIRPVPSCATDKSKNKGRS